MNTTFARIICALFVSALTMGNAIAGDARGRVVQTIVVNHDTLPVFIFKLSGQINAAPSCANAEAGFAVSVKTPAGRAIMNQILLAKALNHWVDVVGQNNCNAWGDRESVSYVVATPGI